ncbi:uncharacterized protein LOC130985474 [Salvia miltiorrhiza]|uniref:uncharacterized protein LOC130985474 n=1 Tax=Salvia miltiorrhiza TaxID=226208 RepID=UPI0025AB8C2E|nr:uncharacterized protein LOC130985474 [Salvia miltiorrhiza]
MITLTATPNAVVAMEGNGWPLGLGNINSRITAPGASEPVAPPPQPRLRQRQISSFSSLSSSDLDTESTASFFPDQSVQLGRLIGMRPIGGNKMQREKEGNVGGEGCHRGGHSPRCGALDSQGFCTPLLHHVIARIFRRPKHTLLSQ